MLIKVGDTTVDIRVHAVLSMPRLSFTSNHFGWWKALMPLGIEPTMGSGAFWDQVNSRIFESVMDSHEYILTLDYDSFILKADVEHLFALALTFGCDALAPIQTKREDGRPMFTMLGTLDNPPEDGTNHVPRDWFAEPVQQVDAAHFGCTIISTKALKRALKPWFWSKPDAQGGWNDGRIDPDIWFWKQWKASGNRCFVTPRVVIGHGEYVITWPGKDLSQPVYQYTTEYNAKGKKPDNIWSAG